MSFSVCRDTNHPRFWDLKENQEKYILQYLRIIEKTNPEIISNSSYIFRSGNVANVLLFMNKILMKNWDCKGETHSFVTKQSGIFWLLIDENQLNYEYNVKKFEFIGILEYLESYNLLQYERGVHISPYYEVPIWGHKTKMTQGCGIPVLLNYKWLSEIITDYVKESK